MSVPKTLRVKDTVTLSLRRNDAEHLFRSVADAIAVANVLRDRKRQAALIRVVQQLGAGAGLIGRSPDIAGAAPTPFGGGSSAS